MIRKNIPNFISLLNLLSGLIALMFVFQQQWQWAFAFVLLGIFFDFFDGLAARSFDSSSELGLQLDSLADMVTSGVVPGFTLFFMIQNSLSVNFLDEISLRSIIPFAGLLVTLGSAFRLAKFNIDTRQTTSFIGLPTPANTLFIMSLPLIAYGTANPYLQQIIASPYFLVSIALISAYILNAEISLFSLKFNNFKWEGNQQKYILILLSIVLIIFFNISAIPFIIVTYVFLSLIYKNKD